MLTFKVSQVRKQNIDDWLNLNFSLFELTDLRIQNMVRLKYDSALNEIQIIELVNSGEKIGHVALIKQKMYIRSEIYEVAFLTSVYIFPKYRGNGYLSPLLAKAEEIASIDNCVASIIIARKAVRDMYSKQGYFGFSVFPSVYLSKNIIKHRHAPPIPVNINEINLKDAYLTSYSALPGTIVRNELYWKSIKYSIECGLFGMVNHNSKESYMITKESTVIEIAGNTNSVINLVERSPINVYITPKNHPIFDYLMQLGGEYRYRPEPKEGHLLKIVNTNSEGSTHLLSLIINDMNLKNIDFNYMNILELNQW